MTTPSHPEINEDLPFAFRFWRIQRIGWTLMTLIILAALAGVFGTGPVSKVTAKSPDLEFTYNRFARYAAPNTYELRLVSQGSGQTITLSDSLVRALKIDSIVPSPTQETRSSEETTFTFESPPSGSLSVTIHGSTNARGLIQGGVSAGSETISITQFIYP